MGKIPPDQKGAESSRPGVSPHRQQASVRSSARPCRNTCGIPTTHTFCPVTNTFRPIAPLPSNLARNSPAAPSNIEFASLELQRFRMVSKNYRLKLCAKFVWVRLATLSGAAARPRLKAWPCSPAWSAPPAGRRIFGGGFAPLGASLRRVAGVSRLSWCNSPVWWCGRGSRWCRAQRADHLGEKRRQWAVVGEVVCVGSTTTPGLARRSHIHPLRCEREPAIACANQLFRTLTRYSVSGRGCPRSY